MKAARSSRMNRTILAIDVGGSNVKMMTNTDRAPRKFKSGPDLTAEQMVRNVAALAKDWFFDVISIGYPGPICHRNRGAATTPMRSRAGFGYGIRLVWTRGQGCVKRFLRVGLTAGGDGGLNNERFQGMAQLYAGIQRGAEYEQTPQERLRDSRRAPVGCFLRRTGGYQTPRHLMNSAWDELAGAVRICCSAACVFGFVGARPGGIIAHHAA